MTSQLTALLLAIATIESENGKRLGMHSDGKSYGWYGVTAPCLADYNKANFSKLSLAQMDSEPEARKVVLWRTRDCLTETQRIVCWHRGPGYCRQWLRSGYMDEEMLDYLSCALHLMEENVK